MKKVYEAPAIEMIAFLQEDVLGASSVAPEMMGDANAILGSGNGSKTENSSAISGGVSLW